MSPNPFSKLDTGPRHKKRKRDGNFYCDRCDKMLPGAPEDPATRGRVGIQVYDTTHDSAKATYLGGITRTFCEACTVEVANALFETLRREER